MDTDMSERAEAFKRIYPQPATLPTWALDVLCTEHIIVQATTKCPGCDGCDLAKMAAHEAFFLLPADSRDALCVSCFDAGLDPMEVFGWTPEDFLRPAN